MNDQLQATQLTLFEPQLPKWAALPQEVQQATLEALSQMLLQAVAAESESNPQTTPEQATSS
jgi:hypothetical protein